MKGVQHNTAKLAAGATCAGTAQFSGMWRKAAHAHSSNSSRIKDTDSSQRCVCPQQPAGTEFHFLNVLCFTNLYIRGGKSYLKLILDVLARSGSWRTETSHGYEGCHEWCCLVTQLLAIYNQFPHTSKIIHDQYSLQLQSLTVKEILIPVLNVLRNSSCCSKETLHVNVVWNLHPGL